MTSTGGGISEKYILGILAIARTYVRREGPSIQLGAVGGKGITSGSNPVR